MRGIRRSRRWEGLVRRLADELHSEVGRPIFSTMRELMCFAAVLGFEYDRRSELDRETEEVDGRIFVRSEQAVDLLYLITLAATRNSELLRDEDSEEIVRIFEEYAQGGLEILDDWLRDKPDDANGDEAILAALAGHGFLTLPEDVESVLDDIVF